MSKIEDGGTAFPVQNDEKLHPSYGMTLRDYFAAQALNCARKNLSRCTAGSNPMRSDELASEAYIIADAMLAERTKDGAT